MAETIQSMDMGLVPLQVSSNSLWPVHHSQTVVALSFLSLDAIILRSYLTWGRLLGGSTSFYGTRIKLHIAGGLLHLLTGTLAVALLSFSANTTDLQYFEENNGRFSAFCTHSPLHGLHTNRTTSLTAPSGSPLRSFSPASVFRILTHTCAATQALLAVFVCGPTTVFLAPYCLGHRGAALVGYTLAGFVWILAGAYQLLNVPSFDQSFQLLVYAHTFALVRAAFWVCFKLGLPTESNTMAYTTAIFLALSITMTSAWGRAGFVLWLCIVALSWAGEAAGIGHKYHALKGRKTDTMSERIGGAPHPNATESLREKSVSNKSWRASEGSSYKTVCCPFLGLQDGKRRRESASDQGWRCFDKEMSSLHQE